MDDVFGEVLLNSDSDVNEINIAFDNVKGVKNVEDSTFEVLTTAEIERLMDQYIDDVKSIIPVGLIAFLGLLNIKIHFT